MNFVNYWLAEHEISVYTHIAGVSRSRFKSTFFYIEQNTIIVSSYSSNMSPEYGNPHCETIESSVAFFFQNGVNDLWML